MGKDSFVYVKHPEFAWVPATLVDTTGDKAKVVVPQYKDEQAIKSDGGRGAKSQEEQVVNLKDYPHKVLPLQNVDNNGQLLAFSDMVQLPYLHEVSAFLNCVEICFVLYRFAHSFIPPLIHTVFFICLFFFLRPAFCTI